MQQVLLGFSSLWEIFLTVKICLEKQIMRCTLPRLEVYGSSLRRSELFLHLRCRPGKRRLKNFIELYRHWFLKVTYLKNELRDLSRSHSPRFDRWRLPKQHTTQAPFIWKKVVPGRRVTRLPELPWASQLFIHFLTKLGEPFTWETKSWLG